MKSYTLDVEGVEVTIERKKVKNINLTIYPPDGRVRVSVPLKCPDVRVSEVIQHRLGWIRRKQAALRALVPVNSSDYLSGEKIRFFGEELELELKEVRKGPTEVKRDGATLIVQTKAGTDEVRRQKILENWLRQQLLEKLNELLPPWSQVLGVNVHEIRVRKMKTRWGSCNVREHRIWINLELARLAPLFLEYVLVHEMVHLLERSHNARFKALMDSYYPDWREVRHRLKRVQV